VLELTSETRRLERRWLQKMLRHLNHLDDQTDWRLLRG
jgi:hypothetical protein